MNTKFSVMPPTLEKIEDNIKQEDENEEKLDILMQEG